MSYRTLSIALFAALLLLVLLTFRNYGISWDEGVHDRVGSNLWTYYLGLLRGRVDLQELNLGNPVAYGGIFNLVTAGVQTFSPLDRFETRHLVNALVGLLGVLGCWKVARLLAAESAAFWAALLLAVIPGYYGHMFFNPKDIPFAAGYIWSLYFILGAVSEFPQISWQTLLKLGLAIGLTMGMRVGGAMLLGYFGLAILFEIALLRPGPDRLVWRNLIRRMLWPVLLVGVTAYIVMLAFWPWAQQNPLANPFLALYAQQQFDYQDAVLYRGVSYSGQALPVDYVTGYLLVTLPEVVLILLAAGLTLASIRLFRNPGGLQNPSFLAKGVLLLLFSILFPVGLVILQNSVLYDGARHFIFILPPVACLAGLGFRVLSERLERIHKMAPAAAYLIIASLIGSQVVTMARLHPYEYIYYNALAGGLKGAYQNYETDYWGLATSEAARWLAEYVDGQSPEQGKVYPVYTCAGRTSASYYFSDHLSLVQEPERAHFGIVITRWGCDREVQGEVLFTIERLGVPLAQVKELY